MIVAQVIAKAPGSPSFVRSWRTLKGSRLPLIRIGSLQFQRGDEMRDFLEQEGDVRLLRTHVIEIPFVNCLGYANKVLVAAGPWDAEDLFALAVHPGDTVTAVFGRQ